MCLMQMAKCILRCSFNVLSGALSIALASGPLTFYSVLSAPRNEILDAIPSAAQSAASISPFAELYCTRNDNCINKCNLKCTFQYNRGWTLLCNFIQMFKCTSEFNSRCIIRCTLNCTTKRISNTFIVVPLELSCASPGTLKISLLL